PELVIGYSVFAAAAIRIDYAKREVVFARDIGAVKSPAAKDIALKDFGGKPLAKAEIRGTDAVMEVDTGNSGGFDLYEKWASAHNLPGTIKSVAQKGIFSAGTEPTVRHLFRLPDAKLGPIEAKDVISSIDAPPDPGMVAGLIGNMVLSRCRAIVFDVE